ncbi:MULTISPECIES: efflux RND transporter periplasmic adaptor subunit [unclassified Campylobacter]|uniref:efflux RND transporter periplasmic adaptor subunit n=1 Tax=unclassified Campylobacter TaxID=2593542 RepID=UPI001BDAFC43|nr:MULTISPECIES: efflux RND transporter periplasmic adaptor subunit [unclassified Campylobacter]MBZ7977739.1 efflux RND transporter periplasmic adaptor subunit [Campylobacter sp. RM12654]MBZ7979672.1 efflux RND transporter periplasmic adaptor subunit [Campylobacter sp. RM12642]MBZ7993595.1 efflux RND transporter periplasmic adaptor subunit [Campylobacter sp. RM9333]MBT0879159.1 efflux RND transporter periplasmic adaptor subunit [Campylobacter sp. 2018MI01]MBT0881301.1 efflux RND transporter pe
MKKLLFLLISLNLFADSIYASFDVVAQKSAKLSLQSFGIVNKINVDVGKSVKKGDILLELDSSIEQVGLEESNVQQKLANEALTLAISTLKRYEQVKSVLNEQILDEINFKKSEAEQRLKSARMSSKKYETLINQKKLKAPFDGVITAKYIEVGEGVASPNQPLLILDSYPEVKLLLSFDEKYSDKVKVGNTYEYSINGLNMKGVISKVYPNIDIKTRKIYAEVLANDIQIGSFGDGYIITDK